MADIFSSARLLISGAREDIFKIDRQIEVFFHSKPYAQVIDRDREAGIDIHKLKMIKKLPALLGRDVSRIASDLRSALDQTGFACAKAAGNRRLKYTYFPIAASEAQLNSVIKGRCKDLPAEIATLFRSFNAYNGGDNLLWSMNEVANGIKHRTMVPIGHGIGSAIIHNLYAEAIHEMRMPPIWDTTKDEIVLLSTPHGTKTSYDINLGFAVAFGEIEPIKGQHVTPILSMMATKVEGIIGATEAKARSRGLTT